MRVWKWSYCLGEKWGQESQTDSRDVTAGSDDGLERGSAATLEKGTGTVS